MSAYGGYANAAIYRMIKDLGGSKKTKVKRRIEPPYGTPIVADDAFCDTIKGASTVLDLSSDASAALVCGFPTKLPGVREWYPRVTTVDLGGPGDAGPASLGGGGGFDAATAFLSARARRGGPRLRGSSHRGWFVGRVPPSGQTP